MAIQEIGIGVDLSKGKFSDTAFKDNVLKLAERGKDSDGNPIYVEHGYWESEAILIQDKITAFKNVARTVNVSGGATYKLYVQTSEDGYTWSAYEETLPSGGITNAPAKYARIKIEIFSESVDSNFYADKFNVKGKYDNEFVDSENGSLSLKREYTKKMELSSSVFVRTIDNSKFKKLDSIKVEKG